MRIEHHGFLPALVFLVLTSCSTSSPEETPLNTIIPVAQRIINETIFNFQPVIQQETHGIQSIDFSFLSKENTQYPLALGLSFIHAERDTLIKFGISYKGIVEILLNDSLVFDGKPKTIFTFSEYTYDRFHFDTSLYFRLKDGPNKILLKMRPAVEQWAIILRPVDETGNQENSVKFNLEPFAPKITTSKWLLMGPFDVPQIASFILPPEKDLAQSYFFNNTYYTWKLPPSNVLKGFVIPENAVFPRESYADWHYGIGAMNMVLLELSDISGNESYLQYVKKYNDFVVENYPYFRNEYETYLAIRGSYHRLVRSVMLDDCGAPALSMLELARLHKEKSYDPVLYRMADYIRNGQLRLEDGTFCRPEPVPNTIWADDLFMSVPFMLRMADYTGDPSWYKDISKQIINFNSYLYDPQTKLYKHGWYSPENETSVAFWARANGWVIWATAEALDLMPEDHRDYSRILSIFQDHLEGISAVQDRSGLWHQVLDKPESFLETSASAMYLIGLARGLRNGWLDTSYSGTAKRAWQGLSSRISEDGIVEGICRGTAIGHSLEFYYERETFSNDPRGLGAVMQAALEMEKWLETIN